MYMDEASFGRISEPAYCWCYDNVRPSVPTHRVREYVYAYGAIDPIDGESCFIVAPRCNADWTNAFLQELSKQFPDDYILLGADQASWHKSKNLKIPENIEFFYIPPYTPEMNPIEAIWKEIRKEGFKNMHFSSLDKVVERLCSTIVNLSKNSIISISCWEWILSMF